MAVPGGAISMAARSSIPLNDPRRRLPQRLMMVVICSSLMCSALAIALSWVVIPPAFFKEPINLRELDVAEINCHDQRVGRRCSVRSASMHSALGRNQNSRELLVLVQVVRGRSSPQNFSVVVVPLHQTVRTDVERLGDAVCRDARRKRHFQAAPSLAVLV